MEKDIIKSKIFSIIKEFPTYKDINLSINSKLSDVIDLVSSLLLERVRVKLSDEFKNINFESLSLNSTIEEIYKLVISHNSEQILQTANVVESKLISSEDKSSIQNNLTISPSVGIDIENKKFLPTNIFDQSCINFRKNIFNISEVAYSLLKPDPELTLLGIFSAKEAIKKSYKVEISYNNIEILHDFKGKPFVKIDGYLRNDFVISISHSVDYAVSFCLYYPNKINEKSFE